MDNNTIYNVKNRSASKVFYKIPEIGVRREFMPGEVKKITYDELQKLSYQAGGRELMADFLQVQSSEMLNELNMRVEPEYNMSEEQIVELIRTGSLDAFLDCLDFAPIGVIDLLKRFAVSVPLSDYDKRQALKEKTGFDVDTALKNLAAEKAEAEEKAEKATQSRRVQVEEQPKPAAGRRTAGTNYKVVSKAE